MQNSNTARCTINEYSYVNTEINNLDLDNVITCSLIQQTITKKIKNSSQGVCYISNTHT